eukprot:TRINITY_DN2812_c0_g1_i1.p1 TRINITY_DN2812_c0_g1~~TRINITY_DN2812_c0_g1_i1.p1  ORF type:complete len:241 (+),score=25.91 TRINITY_DN2812_c0_g1_i1:66-788(+)
MPFHFQSKLVLLSFLSLILFSLAFVNEEVLELDTFARQLLQPGDSVAYTLSLSAEEAATLEQLQFTGIRTSFVGRRMHKSLDPSLIEVSLKTPTQRTLFSNSTIDLGSEIEAGDYLFTVTNKYNYEYNLLAKACPSNCDIGCPLDVETDQVCSGNGGCSAYRRKCRCDVGVAFTIGGDACDQIGDVWVEPATLHLIVMLIAAVPIFGFFSCVTMLCYGNGFIKMFPAGGVENLPLNTKAE